MIAYVYIEIHIEIMKARMNMWMENIEKNSDRRKLVIAGIYMDFALAKKLLKEGYVEEETILPISDECKKLVAIESTKKKAGKLLAWVQSRLTDIKSEHMSNTDFENIKSQRLLDLNFR